MVIAVLPFCFGLMQVSRKPARLKLLRVTHSIFAIAALIIIYISLCLAFDHSMFRLTVPVEVVNFTLALTVLVLIGTLVGVVCNIIYRWKIDTYINIHKGPGNRVTGANVPSGRQVPLL